MRFQDAARDGRAVVYAGIQADPLVKRAAALLVDASPTQRVLARAVMNGETTDRARDGHAEHAGLAKLLYEIARQLAGALDLFAAHANDRDEITEAPQDGADVRWTRHGSSPRAVAPLA